MTEEQECIGTKFFFLMMRTFKIYCLSNLQVYNTVLLMIVTILHVVLYGWSLRLKKGNARECSNYCTIALISHASKVMLKILQASLQQYMNREFPDVQAGFRKGRGTRDQIANICWIIEKIRVTEKHLFLFY